MNRNHSADSEQDSVLGRRWHLHAFVLLLGLLLPLGHFALQMKYHQGTLASEAHIHAAMVAHALAEDMHAPDLLSRPGAELDLYDLIEGDIDDNEYNERYEQRELLDKRERAVVSAGVAQLPWPVLTFVAPIRHDEALLGYFSIRRSLAPVVLQSVWLAMVSLPVAWMLVFLLRRLPLRALSRAQARLSHLARYDPLTELPNRTELQRHLSAVLRRNRKLALLHLDLDRFKLVNESNGHHVGDAILRLAAQRIVNAVRVNDVVARLASDEFVVVLENVANGEQARNVARKLLEKFHSPFVLNDQSFLLTLTIGIALSPQDGASADDLLRHASAALFAAKASARDNFGFYRHDMQERLQTRMQMQTLLHQALQNRELVLHYQPIVDLRSNAVAGMEVLLRWRSPVLGMVSPAAFIDILEDTGLIVPVGAWVLREACGQAKRWLDQGVAPFELSVNVSARQFRDADLLPTVLGILEQTGFPANLLQLELTESMLMTDQAVSVATLDALASHGIRVAIDDFGTAYSSLAYLSRFRVHTLKIDRSFVADTHTPTGAKIVSAVIALAHNLQLSVTAEGVETKAQRALLQQYDCDTAQGYLFSKPLDVEAAEAYLRAHAPRREPVLTLAVPARNG